MAARTSAAPGAAVSTALELVVTRVLDAPRPQVFEAWTGPERLGRWWGPRGFRAPAGKLGVGAGGAWRVAMRSPQGKLRWLRCACRELAAPERLVFSWAFEDAAGQAGPETLVTVSFAEQEGGTRLIVRRAAFEPPIPDGLEPEDERGDWEESLDRLEDYLREVQMTEETADGHDR